MSVNLEDPLVEPSDSELDEIAKKFGFCVADHTQRVRTVFLEKMSEAINKVANETCLSHKIPCARF